MRLYFFLFCRIFFSLLPAPPLFALRNLCTPGWTTGNNRWCNYSIDHDLQEIERPNSGSRRRIVCVAHRRIPTCVYYENCSWTTIRLFWAHYTETVLISTPHLLVVFISFVYFSMPPTFRLYFCLLFHKPVLAFAANDPIVMHDLVLENEMKASLSKPGPLTATTLRVCSNRVACWLWGSWMIDKRWHNGCLSCTCLVGLNSTWAKMLFFQKTNNKLNLANRISGKARWRFPSYKFNGRYVRINRLEMNPKCKSSFSRDERYVKSL